MSGARGEPLGAVYAEALAQAAQARGSLVEVAAEVADTARAWEQDADFRTFFLSGAIHRTAKAKALDRVFRGRASDLTTDFLHVMLRRGRLRFLPDVAAAMGRLLDVRLGRMPVTLETAVEVGAEDLEGLRARIRAAIGKEPVLKPRVRPALIGGAVLRVGDVVADGSVRRRLADLRDRTILAARAAVASGAGISKPEQPQKAP